MLVRALLCSASVAVVACVVACGGAGSGAKPTRLEDLLADPQHGDPSRIPSLTADDLRRDFEHDPAAATRRHVGQDLAVEGSVVGRNFTPPKDGYFEIEQPKWSTYRIRFVFDTASADYQYLIRTYTRLVERKKPLRVRGTLRPVVAGSPPTLELADCFIPQLDVAAHWQKRK